jgi:hypothetical protein
LSRVETVRLVWAVCFTLNVWAQSRNLGAKFRVLFLDLESVTNWVGRFARSEEDEDLADVAFNVLHLLADDVEADGLGEGAALTDGHDITGTEAESGRAVSGHGLVALLKPVVLLDEVEVVAADDDGVLHLGGDNDTPIVAQSQLVMCQDKRLSGVVNY